MLLIPEGFGELFFVGSATAGSARPPGLMKKSAAPGDFWVGSGILNY
jgi:hypothetical protein